MAARPLLINATLKLSQIEKILKPRPGIARISPPDVIAVLKIEKLRKHLAIVDVRRGNRESADDAVRCITDLATTGLQTL